MSPPSNPPPSDPATPSTPPPPSSKSGAPPPSSGVPTPPESKSGKLPKVKQRGLYRNWVSYAGAMFATGSFMLILIFIALEASEGHPSPYIGIFTYMTFPMGIVLGIMVALVGMRLEARRRVKAGTTEAQRFPALDLNDPKQRKRFGYVAAVGFVLFIVMTYTGYNGFLLTESVGFCGKTCHTPMGPEMTAYEDSPHAGVPCVDCHVGSGAGSYVHSKANGMFQMLGVMTNSYSRPIPTPVKGLRPARETCQECHWPKKFFGSQLYQRAHFRYDEQSTPDQITMMIKTGGGGVNGAGIHWHMLVDNEVTFVTQDEQLQDIPWVKIKRRDGSTTEYFRNVKKVEPGDLDKLPHHTMDCMDCHNRPAHQFEAPDVAVDRALSTGVFSQTLPFVKSLSVDTLSKDYPTREAGHEGLKRDVEDFYKQKYPDIATARTVDIDKLVVGLTAIYDRNVFPEMKVSWKTYLSNLGHRNSAGCFRCHDGKHVAADGTVLISECKACHTEPKRGPQSGMGESMTTFEKDWHPWQIPEKHLAIAQHKEIQCYECHLAGRRPKTECNECHSH